MASRAKRQSTTCAVLVAGSRLLARLFLCSPISSRSPHSKATRAWLSLGCLPQHLTNYNGGPRRPGFSRHLCDHPWTQQPPAVQPQHLEHSSFIIRTTCASGELCFSYYTAPREQGPALPRFHISPPPHPPPPRHSSST